MDGLMNKVREAVTRHVPNSIVRRVVDKGALLKRTFQADLEDGRTVFVKMVTRNEDAKDLVHMDTAVRLFISHGLPAPRILAIDSSSEILPYPYLIQEQIEGTKLRALLRENNESEMPAVYEAIGRFYRSLHSIKNDRSGLFCEDPRKLLYPISPNDYMFGAEIVRGSGENAEAEGKITERTHRRLIDTWGRNMEYLKDHTPSLVHISPFPWNIYLTKEGQDWRVSKVMSMGDVLWWDPAIDLSIIKYPPFEPRNEEHWQSFLRGYGMVPERKRVLLYALLQLLCAAMGVYMEPADDGNDAWSDRALQELDRIMDEIGALD